MTEVTIRKASPEQRRNGFAPLVAGRPRIRAQKYVVVNADGGGVWTVFGLPQGGDTRAEAVFWAERLASKNGFDYLPPPGWENVVGKLP